MKTLSCSIGMMEAILGMMTRIYDVRFTKWVPNPNYLNVFKILLKFIQQFIQHANTSLSLQGSNKESIAKKAKHPSIGTKKNKK
jgi:hypothetical protein